jgi:colicin import membrane protein
MAANLVEVITPMPDSSAKTRAEAALERVKSLVIRTHDDYAAAAADLAEVKGQFRAVDKQREELKAPSLEACRRVDSFFKPPLQFLGQAETILKGKLSAYDAEQERLRREEQARLDEIARQERLRKEAEAREVERKAREKADAERRAAETQRQAEAKARREAEGSQGPR